MGVRREGGRHPRTDWRTVGQWFAGVAGIGLALWLWRRSRRPQVPEIQKLWGGVVRALARQGFVRDPSESPTR